jgi:hypothetical protein
MFFTADSLLASNIEVLYCPPDQVCEPDAQIRKNNAEDVKSLNSKDQELTLEDLIEDRK